jgi:hypothetical protein
MNNILTKDNRSDRKVTKNSLSAGITHPYKSKYRREVPKCPGFSLKNVTKNLFYFEIEKKFKLRLNPLGEKFIIITKFSFVLFIMNKTSH